MAIDFSVVVKVKPGRVSGPEQFEIGSNLAFLPRAGDILTIDAAPKGLSHRVKDIVHNLGTGEQRVTLWCEEIDMLAASAGPV